MKREKVIRIAATVMAMMLLPLLATAQQVNETTSKRGNDTVKFEVSITCENCINTIMSNLPKERGVRDVRPDLEEKTVTVIYRRNRNSREKIIKSLKKLGFTAKVADASRD